MHQYPRKQRRLPTPPKPNPLTNLHFIRTQGVQSSEEIELKRTGASLVTTEFMEPGDLVLLPKIVTFETLSWIRDRSALHEHTPVNMEWVRACLHQQKLLDPRPFLGIVFWDFDNIFELEPCELETPEDPAVLLPHLPLDLALVVLDYADDITGRCRCGVGRWTRPVKRSGHEEANVCHVHKCKGFHHPHGCHDPLTRAFCHRCAALDIEWIMCFGCKRWSMSYSFEIQTCGVCEHSFHIGCKPVFKHVYSEFGKMSLACEDCHSTQEHDSIVNCHRQGDLL